MTMYCLFLMMHLNTHLLTYCWITVVSSYWFHFSTNLLKFRCLWNNRLHLSGKAADDPVILWHLLTVYNIHVQSITLSYAKFFFLWFCIYSHPFFFCLQIVFMFNFFSFTGALFCPLLFLTNKVNDNSQSPDIKKNIMLLFDIAVSNTVYLNYNLSDL